MHGGGAIQSKRRTAKNGVALEITEPIVEVPDSTIIHGHSSGDRSLVQVEQRRGRPARPRAKSDVVRDGDGVKLAFFHGERAFVDERVAGVTVGTITIQSERAGSNLDKIAAATDDAVYVQGIRHGNTALAGDIYRSGPCIGTAAALQRASDSAVQVKRFAGNGNTAIKDEAGIISYERGAIGGAQRAGRNGEDFPVIDVGRSAYRCCCHRAASDRDLLSESGLCLKSGRSSH